MNREDPARRAVVTGLGAVTPIGNDHPTFWANAVAGKSGGGPITHFVTELGPAAINTIWHDAAHASRVILPVMK